MGETIQLITMTMPNFLVAVAGFVLAGIFMAKARTAALLVLIASLLSLFHMAFMAFQHFVMLEMLYDDKLSSDTYALVSTGVYNGLYLVISALMLGAAFSGRQHAVTTAPANPVSATRTRAHRGGLVLTLGLLGVLLFAPIGIAAWVLGNRDLAAMRQGSMDASGEGMTLAGKILGILATVMLILGIIVVIGTLIVLVSSYRGF
ncbi:MAG: hypothetical protein VX793_01595 [Pseudomonadota bacterium]|nr:hypothetical protein [Pseudomonadota bacterium]